MNLNTKYMVSMSTEGASMSYATLQKQRCYRWERTTQKETDTVGEGITIGLILLLGIVSIVNSISIVVNSVALVIKEQLVLMELLKTLIVAGFLLAIGCGAIYFFRKKLHALARKKSPWGL